jgi:hypothetical protein
VGDRALWQAVFASSVKDAKFDAVLVLAPAEQLRVAGREGKYRNLDVQDAAQLELADVPRLLLRDLQARFGRLVDLYAGAEHIGVVFKELGEAPFRVAAARVAVPVEGKDAVALNRVELLDECARIGRGVVVAVEYM